MDMPVDSSARPAGSLAGRRAVVTGGASGIGAAVARRLAARGADVILCDLPGQAAAGEDLAAAIRRDGGLARFAVLDVTDEDGVEAVLAEAARDPGEAGILVTSAGVDAHPQARRRVTLAELPPEEWSYVLDVNLYGTFRCARAFAEHLRAAQRPGSIITLASLAAKKPRGGVYAVSKAAVWMLTRVLATELGPYGIRVNSVAPGLIDTPMLARRTSLAGGQGAVGSSVEEFYSAEIARLPLRRLGTADEVASVVAFLASDDSSYLTGSLLSPDGGFATVDAGG